MSEPQEETTPDELPPFFKTWKQMYIAVMANLLLIIILFYWFTKYFE